MRVRTDPTTSSVTGRLAGETLRISTGEGTSTAEAKAAPSVKNGVRRRAWDIFFIGDGFSLSTI
jgi:hypothetical protein